MARRTLDKDTKKEIAEARKMVEAIAKADANEAETRRRIDRIFERILGYDTLKHLTREYAIHGAGDTVHCDLAVQLGRQESSRPDILVEVKRVGINLAPKHVRQAASYAIDIGCEWVLLTNSKEWKLYHIAYGKPPETKVVESWNLMDDDASVLGKKFAVISCRSVRTKCLDTLWEKRTALTPGNMLKAILAEESIKLYQRRLKKSTGVSISPEDIVSQFRHLLNESALSEMSNIKITLPARQQRTKASRARKTKLSPAEPAAEAAPAARDARESEESADTRE